MKGLSLSFVVHEHTNKCIHLNHVYSGLHHFPLLHFILRTTLQGRLDWESMTGIRLPREPTWHEWGFKTRSPRY